MNNFRCPLRRDEGPQRRDIAATIAVTSGAVLEGQTTGTGRAGGTLRRVRAGRELQRGEIRDEMGPAKKAGPRHASSVRSENHFQMQS